MWEDIAAKYESEHAGVDIQLQFLENEAFKAKLPTLLQSDDAPHFFYSWGGGVLKQQSETGALMDLTEAMRADGGAWEKSYNPAALKGFTFDDRIYAVPFKMGTISFFYNKELFQKGGVKAEDIKSRCRGWRHQPACAGFGRPTRSLDLAPELFRPGSRPFRRPRRERCFRRDRLRTDVLGRRRPDDPGRPRTRMSA